MYVPEISKQVVRDVGELQGRANTLGEGRLSGLTSPVVTQRAAGMFRLRRLSPHL